MDQSLLNATNQLQQQHQMLSSQHSLLIQSYDHGPQRGTNNAPTRQYSKNTNGGGNNGGGESRNNLQPTAENNSNPNYKTANGNFLTITQLQTMVAPPAMIMGQSYGTQVVKKLQTNNEQPPQRLNNGTPIKAIGSIKKPANKMNGGGNHADEEEDQQLQKNRITNHRSSLSNQPPLNSLHNAAHFEDSPPFRHTMKQKLNNLPLGGPQTIASNRLPPNHQLASLPEALGIIDSQQDENSTCRGKSSKMQVQQKKGNSIPQQQQVVQSFINQSKFGGQQSQIMQDVVHQTCTQNFRNLTTSGSRKLSVNPGGGGTTSFYLRPLQPTGANSQQKQQETRIAANAAFNNHKQHLITTMTTLPDYSSDEEQQIPLPMSTRFRNNGGDYTDSKKQGNSTSELGFQQPRSVATVNPSFFPAGKRQKTKGPKKLLPTQQLLPQPTGITYTSGGGKIFDYISKGENPVSLQSPMLLSYNSKNIQIDEQYNLNKINPQQQSKEALMKNKNFFSLQTTEHIVTPSKIRSLVGVSGQMQLSNQQSIIQQQNDRHFFTSQSIQQQLHSNAVTSPNAEPKRKQSPQHFYQSPQSQMTKHNPNNLQMEKPTLMNGNGQKLHSSNTLNQHPLLAEITQLNMTAPGTQESEFNNNNSLDLDENLAELQKSGIKKGQKKGDQQFINIQHQQQSQQPMSFSQFDPQFPQNPYNKRLNSTLHSTNKKVDDLDPITRGIPKQLTSENVTSQLQKYTKLIQFEELPPNTQNTVQYVKMMQKNAAIQQIQQQSQIVSNTNRVQQQLNKGAFSGITGPGGAGGANFLNQTKKSYASNQKQAKAQLQQWQLQMQQQQLLQQGQWPQGSQTMKLQPDFRFSQTNSQPPQHITILQEPKYQFPQQELFSQTTVYNNQKPMLFTTQNEPVQLINAQVYDPNLYYKQLGNALQQAQVQLSGVYSAVMAGSQQQTSQFRGSQGGKQLQQQQQQSIMMGGMLQHNSPQPPPLIIQQTQLYTGSTVNNQFKQGPMPTRIVDPNNLVGFLEIQRVTMALPGANTNCNHHQHKQGDQMLSHPTNSVEKIHLQQRPQCCAHLQPHQQPMYQFLVQSPQVVTGNAYLLRKQQQNNKYGARVDNEELQPIEVKQVNQNYLYFTVIPGNNSGIIRDAMLRRSNKWKETSSFNDPNCHFRWQPVSYGLKFDQLGILINPNVHPYTKQLVNHFECHSHLTEKSKLFKNLQDYALTRLRENVFNYIPLTFFVEVDISKTKLFAKAMLPFFNSFYALEDNKKKVVKYYEKVDEFNHLGALHHTQTNLDQPLMAKSMGSLPNLLGQNSAEIHQTQSNSQLPIKPAGQSTALESPLEEAFIFKHFYNNRRGLIKQHLKEEKDALDNHKGALKKNFFRYTMPFCHFTGFNLWLLKPTKLNRGRGIHVINNLTQLKALIQRYCEGWSKPNGSTVVTAAAAPKIGTQGQRKEDAQIENGVDAQFDLQPCSPDKDGADMGTDEEEESPTTQPSSSLPPLNQSQEEAGSRLNNQQTTTQQQPAQPQKPQQQQQQQYKIKHNSFILQKYIEKPFLIYQRKFDIRVWVFVNYDTSLYFFPEGYLRTSSSEFAIDPNNPDDQYVHLTNNAIQKYSQSYGIFEDGNQMSYTQFQDYLDNNGFSYSVKDDIVETMKSLIMRSMLATRKILDPQKRRGCFELFGYDFILDEDFNTWLIEVNTNPCIEESSKILKVLIPRMLDDMLKLSVDQYFNDFQPKKRQQQQSFDDDEQTQQPVPPQNIRFPVPGYDDDENMWELMCKLGDKKSKKEAKARYVTQSPLPMNSKFAFQVKDREFKIKKYLQPTVATGGPTTAGVQQQQQAKEQVAAITSPLTEGERSASGGITENTAAGS